MGGGYEREGRMAGDSPRITSKKWSSDHRRYRVVLAFVSSLVSVLNKKVVLPLCKFWSDAPVEFEEELTLNGQPAGTISGTLQV